VNKRTLYLVLEGGLISEIWADPEVAPLLEPVVILNYDQEDESANARQAALDRIQADLGLVGVDYTYPIEILEYREQARHKDRYLTCTRGCDHDTHNPQKSHLKPGYRCPNTLTYAIGRPTTYCRRVLRPTTPERVAHLRRYLDK
jgi:hypothetical protein